MSTPKEIAARLELAREAAGLTQEQLEVEAGIGRGAYSNIKNGKREKPKAETIEKLARRLGVTVDWVMGGVGDGPTSNPTPAQAKRGANRTDIYTHRATAIELLRGKVDTETLEAAKVHQLKDAGDPDVREWMLKIYELDSLRKMDPKEHARGTEAARELDAPRDMAALKKGRKR